VANEIEQGLAIMESHTPDAVKAKAKAEADGTNEYTGGTPKNARERLAEYYAKQRAKALASAKTDDPADKVGRCQIRGTIHFTRRSDCRLRGGRFL
jgi:hypothetical protein